MASPGTHLVNKSWVPVQKTVSPKLKMLGLLCYQTDITGYSTKTSSGRSIFAYCTGRVPWFFVRLWGFLCVRDAGRGGNEITGNMAHKYCPRSILCANSFETYSSSCKVVVAINFRLENLHFSREHFILLHQLLNNQNVIPLERQLDHIWANLYISIWPYHALYTLSSGGSCKFLPAVKRGKYMGLVCVSHTRYAWGC